jgi:integrase
MTADLAKPHRAELAALVKSASDYADATITSGVRKEYFVAFRRFRVWATDRQLPFLPTTPEVVILYFTALAQGLVRIDYIDRYGTAKFSQKRCKVSYIRRQYTAIMYAHREAGHDWPQAHPGITKVLSGIARKHGETVKRMAPLEIADLKKCLEIHKHWPPEIVIRDKALLSLGFFAALRRSELVGLQFGDVEFVPKGLRLTIRKSKTDQTALGQEIAIPHQDDATVCPVRLLRAWLDHLRDEAYITAGPIFRRVDIHGCVGARQLTGDSVADIIKGIVEKAGLDPDRYAGHSLRAGFATSAAAAGKTLHNVMRQGRWKSEKIAHTYIRHGSLFRNNAAAGLSTAEIEDGDGRDEK